MVIRACAAGLSRFWGHMHRCRPRLLLPRLLLSCSPSSPVLSWNNRADTAQGRRASLMRPCLPAYRRASCPATLGRDGLDLQTEPVHVDIHHRIVGFVGRAAEGVGHEDDPEAHQTRPSRL